jgi:competence protein ComEA
MLVAGAGAVLAAVGVWREAPRAEPVADLPALVETTVATSAAPTPAPPAEPLVVAVSGRVARPGLVFVPHGARVADVLDAAGGALPGTDLGTLNLARRVSDGEQVAVGVPAAPDAAPHSAPPPGGGTAEAGAGAPLDLNTATVEQLDGLPGVGPVTAQRIVDWRARNGRFATVDQLREIEGIGERRFGQLRGLVRV